MRLCGSRIARRFPLDLDKPMLLKATVKDHSTYNDKKQTVLTRVALHVEKPEKARKMPPLCNGDSLQSGAISSGVLSGYAAQPLQNAVTLK